VSQITSEVKEIKGVKDIHDVHLWTITSGIYALSCHLLIEDRMVSNSAEIVAEVNQTLSQKFGIGHSIPSNWSVKSARTVQCVT
jgi:cobalt-zinc-cadmium efflux system protein